MIISKDKVVTIDYSLTDEEGELIDSSVAEELLVYDRAARAAERPSDHAPVCITLESGA